MHILASSYFLKPNDMKLLLPLAFLVLFAVPGFTQTENSTSVLSNKDVIELVNSGLSETIVVAKIRASETKFDVSTPALKSLSDAKVPDSVIVVMLEKEQKTKEQATADRKDSDRSRNSIPEQGTLLDIANFKRVYIMTENAKSRDIIAKELAKEKRFETVERIEDAEFVLKYEESEEEIGASGSVYGNTANVKRKVQKVGLLNVVMPSANQARLRLLYTTRKTKYFVWEGNPAESTTKQFLKDFSKFIPH
jgi:hypothetical protein